MDLLIELKIISYLKINTANPLRDLYININIVHIYCTLIVHFYIDFNKMLRLNLKLALFIVFFLTFIYYNEHYIKLKMKVKRALSSQSDLVQLIM